MKTKQYLSDFSKMSQHLNVNDHQRSIKILIAALVVNGIAYNVFLFQYLLQNHGMRFPVIPFHDQFHAGRWFTPFFYLLSSFLNLTFFQAFLSMILSILSAMICMRILRDRESSCFQESAPILFITLCPVMLAPFYYYWQVNMFVGSIFLSLLALLIANKFCPGRILLSSIFVMLAMATYQTCLSVLVTVGVGYIIILLLDNVSDHAKLIREIVNFFLPKFFAIIIGVLLYRISLPLFGLGVSAYAQPIHFSDLPARAVKVIHVSFQSLLVTQPEFGITLKILLFIIIALAFLSGLCVIIRLHDSLGRKFLYVIFFCTLFFVFIVATKSMFLVTANNNFHEYRYNFALPYLYGICLYIAFRYTIFPHSKVILFILSALVILFFIQADLVRQSILIRSQQHDLAIANRILYRIESLPDLDVGKEYYLVRTGRYSQFKVNALRALRKYDVKGDTHMDYGEFSDLWTPASAMQLLGSRIKWKGVGFMPDYNDKIFKAIRLAKSQGRKPWPHSSSIFIHDDWIIVYM